MNISIVKDTLRRNVGRKAIIKCNLGRKKYEEYQAIIKEIYDNIFLVELNKDNNIEIKSFSYNDIITKNIRIEY